MLLFVERGPGEVEFVGEGRVARYTRAGSRIRDLHFDLRPPRSRAAWLEDLGDSLPPLDEPPPEAAIARLAPDAGPDDCWTALTTFLQRWHRTTLRGTGPEAPVGPPLLRKMYAIAGEIPGTFRHNDLVPPERLRVDDGRLVFLYENQAVCLWATEPQGADPKVWFRVNEPEKPWIDEPERLSGFLIQAVLFEAISHARFGAHLSGAEAAVRDSVLAHVDPLALGRWDWLGARFYARDGALAMTMENGDRFDVSLAAATPLALSVFEHIVTPDWDYVAF